MLIIYNTQDSRSFDKLGVLCVCNDRPLPEKQSNDSGIYNLKLFYVTTDQIIEKLVKKHGKVASCIKIVL